MVHLNVQVIPWRYLLERWEEVTRTNMDGVVDLLSFGLPSETEGVIHQGAP